MLSNKNDYGYAIGLIRVLESRLLTDAQVTRMCEAKTADEAYLVLNDTDFADFIADFPRVKDFEQVIENSLLATKTRLNKVVNNTEVLCGLWAWFDFYNAKIAVKSFLKHKSWSEIEPLLSPLGDLEFETIKAFAYQDMVLPQFKLAKDKAKIALDKSETNIRWVDFYFDQALGNYLLAWAKKMQSAYLIKFIQKRIDLINATVFLRLTENQRSEMYQDVFIAGGTYSLSSFSKSLNLVQPILLNILDNDNQLLNELLEKGDYVFLNKKIEDILMKVLLPAKFIAEGPEPVIAYWWARKRSAEVVRTILAGKINGVDSELIRKSVVILY